MERKSKIEIILAILVLLALAVLLWWLLLKKPTTPDTTLPTNTEQANPSTSPEVVPTDDIQVTTAPTIARTFVERLGSFSTESGYKNIDDVMVLATDSLQNELKNLKNQALSAPESTYYGVSTRVVSLTTDNESDAKAEITILTQRTESIDDPRAKETRYQNIELTLVKDGEDWLVEDYTWLE